jgi:hypothetical protein
MAAGGYLHRYSTRESSDEIKGHHFPPGVRYGEWLKQTIGLLMGGLVLLAKRTVLNELSHIRIE